MSVPLPTVLCQLVLKSRQRIGKEGGERVYFDVTGKLKVI